MRRSYPSDISKEQFEKIREDLTGGKKITRPFQYDLYDIFCAVLYLLKEGCTWRAIPHDFPKWQNVRYHYDVWAAPDENGEALVKQYCKKKDLKPFTRPMTHIYTNSKDAEKGRKAWESYVRKQKKELKDGRSG